MNDKQFAMTQDRIQKIFAGLIESLNLDRVRWDLAFIREKDSCHEDNSTTMAEIFPNWQYGAATVHFYVWTFEDKDDDEAAEIIIHELVHFWLNPISRYGQSKEYDLLEENVCTEIARAIRKAISQASKQTTDHWRLEVKRLQKEIKKLQVQGKDVA